MLVRYQESQRPALARTFGFGLMQSFPNPFAERTTIPFSVPGGSLSKEKVKISVDIYDVSGRLIRRLVREEMFPGACQVVWDGKTTGGKDAPPAIYMCRLEIGEKTRTKKVILVR